jgi:biotin carboxyl carrier protein
VAHKVTVRVGGRTYKVEVREDRVLVDGAVVELGQVTQDDRGGLVIVQGSRRLRAVHEHGDHDDYLMFSGRELVVDCESERDRLLREFSQMAGEEHHHTEIHALMPGMVVKVMTKVGRDVEKGQPVMILEAMKMENELRAPTNGVVKEIHVREGLTVEKGDLLLVME